MDKRFILGLCVLIGVMAPAFFLVNAASTPVNAPLQTCVNGTTTCAGFNQYLCNSNQWLLKEMNSASCGFTAPTPPPAAFKEILTCSEEGSSATETSKTIVAGKTVDFGSEKNVTLYSGGVSGGLAFPAGGVPAGGTVVLANLTPKSEVIIALPLFSEITIPNVQVIEVNCFVPVHENSNAVGYTYSIESSVIYSVS